MASTTHRYELEVLNRNGYVMLLPNVGEKGDLIYDIVPDPYAESSTQLFPLGTELIQAERKWHYTKAGSVALDIGAPQQNAPSVHADQEEDIVCSTLSAIGSHSLWLKSTANLDGAPNDVKDNFKEGYIHVNDGTGQGQCLKIKSNDLFNVTDDNEEFVTYDGLTIATVAADSEFGLIQNPYDRVIVAAAPLTGMCVGVPGIAVTANYYFWLQFKGPASVTPQASISLGTEVVVGTTSGKVNAFSAFTTEIPIGIALTGGITDDEEMMIFLNLP